MKELKELNKWKDIPLSWNGRLNIVKVAVLCKLTYRFNIIPIKIPFFNFLQKLILKIIEMQVTLRAKTILVIKITVDWLILTDFKTLYKITVIKIVQYWHKDRYMHQWNTIDSPEINHYNYDQYIRTLITQQLKDNPIRNGQRICIDISPKINGQ